VPSWTFVLNELADGNTRLVIRERYAFTRWWASLIVEPVLAISFVMTQKMLNGIRARAERGRTAAHDSPTTTTSDRSACGRRAPGVYLYWLPLGAGASVVRLSGRAFEAITARLQHRQPRDLFHSALEVVTPNARFIIEMTPIPAYSDKTGGLSPNAPWATNGRGRSACSAMRSTGGGMAPSRMWPVRSRAPCRYRPTPQSPNGCSTSRCRYPHRCGARRATRRGDVELQLGYFLALGSRRRRRSRHSTAAQRPRARLGRGSRSCRIGTQSLDEGTFGPRSVVRARQTLQGEDSLRSLHH
jgi:hypothetical protein